MALAIVSPFRRKKSRKARRARGAELVEVGSPAAALARPVGAGLVARPGFLGRVGGFVGRMVGALTGRSIPPSGLGNPSRDLYEVLTGGGGPVFAGSRSVNEQTAISSTPVYACVSLISQTLGRLPLQVIETQKDGTRREAPEHWAWGLLKEAPNETETACVFWEQLAWDLLLAGNAFATLQMFGSGRVFGILRVDPRSVWVAQVNGRNVYSAKVGASGDPAADFEILDQSRVLHVRAHSFDGMTGLSPIQVARQSVGLSLATEEYGARLFSQSAKPAGVLKHPGQISKPAAERLKESWARNYEGPENIGRTVVLEEGMEWQPISVTAKDAEYIELRRFQVAEVARIYRVPLHMIQEQTKDTAWGSGLEQQNIAFVEYTIGPWSRRFEQEIDRKILGLSKPFRSRFNQNALLSGDSAARAALYSSGIQNGWLTPNEVRRREDLPPGDGGDRLYFNGSLVPITKAGEQNTAPNTKAPTPPGPSVAAPAPPEAA